MTEGEWLTGKVPRHLLDRAAPVAWDRRKVRLFWCACLRRAWNGLTDERTRRLVEAVEQRPEADAAWFERECSFAFEGYYDARNGTVPGAYYDGWAFATFFATPPASLSNLAIGTALRAGAAAARAAGLPEWSEVGKRAEAAESERQAELVREVFGNPFRPVALDPAWLTSDVLALARQMDASRDFGAMAILADALQDAGCDSEDVLSHCRAANWEHVRGCWVIDLLLAKG